MMSSDDPAPQTPAPDEEELRTQLRAAYQELQRREPLDTTYRHLLMNGVVTPRKPILPKDKLYKSIGGRLREQVTAYMEQPTSAFDRIAQRQPLDETAMRAAFTLREGKKHEQQALLNATLAAQSHPDDSVRKRRLEEITLGLQNIKKPKAQKGSSTRTNLSAGGGADAMSLAEKERDNARIAEMERDRLRQQIAREAARRRQEEEERRAREEEQVRRRMMESPKLALQGIYQPIFQALWDMEFGNLGGTNPFRIVIDRENCAAMGAADYFDVIQTPMNLTFIQDKVQNASYETLQQFFTDVDLMLQNSLLYNSDPNNDFHIAAREMQRKYKKIAKRVVSDLQRTR